MKRGLSSALLLLSLFGGDLSAVAPPNRHRDPAPVNKTTTAAFTLRCPVGLRDDYRFTEAGETGKSLATLLKSLDPGDAAPPSGDQIAAWNKTLAQSDLIAVLLQEGLDGATRSALRALLSGSSLAEDTAASTRALNAARPRSALARAILRELVLARMAAEAWPPAPPYALLSRRMEAAGTLQAKICAQSERESLEWEKLKAAGSTQGLTPPLVLDDLRTLRDFFIGHGLALPFDKLETWAAVPWSRRGPVSLTLNEKWLASDFIGKSFADTLLEGIRRSELSRPETLEHLANLESHARALHVLEKELKYKLDDDTRWRLFIAPREKTELLYNVYGNFLHESVPEHKPLRKVLRFHPETLSFRLVGSAEYDDANPGAESDLWQDLVALDTIRLPSPPNVRSSYNLFRVPEKAFDQHHQHSIARLQEWDERVRADRLHLAIRSVGLAVGEPCELPGHEDPRLVDPRLIGVLAAVDGRLPKQSPARPAPGRSPLQRSLDAALGLEAPPGEQDMGYWNGLASFFAEEGQAGEGHLPFRTVGKLKRRDVDWEQVFDDNHALLIAAEALFPARLPHDLSPKALAEMGPAEQRKALGRLLNRQPGRGARLLLDEPEPGPPPGARYLLRELLLRTQAFPQPHPANALVKGRQRKLQAIIAEACRRTAAAKRLPEGPIGTPRPGDESLARDLQQLLRFHRKGSEAITQAPAPAGPPLAFASLRAFLDLEPNSRTRLVQALPAIALGTYSKEYIALQLKEIDRLKERPVREADVIDRLEKLLPGALVAEAFAERRHTITADQAKVLSQLSPADARRLQGIVDAMTDYGPRLLEALRFDDKGNVWLDKRWRAGAENSHYLFLPRPGAHASEETVKWFRQSGEAQDREAVGGKGTPNSVAFDELDRKWGYFEPAYLDLHGRSAAETLGLKGPVRDLGSIARRQAAGAHFAMVALRALAAATGERPPAGSPTALNLFEAAEYAAILEHRKQFPVLTKEKQLRLDALNEKIQLRRLIDRTTEAVAARIAYKKKLAGAFPSRGEEARLFLGLGVELAWANRQIAVLKDGPKKSALRNLVDAYTGLRSDLALHIGAAYLPSADAPPPKGKQLAHRPDTVSIRYGEEFGSPHLVGVTLAELQGSKHIEAERLSPLKSALPEDSFFLFALARRDLAKLPTLEREAVTYFLRHEREAKGTSIDRMERYRSEKSRADAAIEKALSRYSLTRNAGKYVVLPDGPLYKVAEEIQVLVNRKDLPAAQAKLDALRDGDEKERETHSDLLRFFLRLPLGNPTRLLVEGPQGRLFPPHLRELSDKEPTSEEGQLAKELRFAPSGWLALQWAQSLAGEAETHNRSRVLASLRQARGLESAELVLVPSPNARDKGDAASPSPKNLHFSLTAQIRKSVLMPLVVNPQSWTDTSIADRIDFGAIERTFRGKELIAGPERTVEAAIRELVLDAVAIRLAKEGKRAIPLEKLFQGPPGEKKLEREMTADEKSRLALLDNALRGTILTLERYLVMRYLERSSRKRMTSALNRNPVAALERLITRVAESLEQRKKSPGELVDTLEHFGPGAKSDPFADIRLDVGWGESEKQRLKRRHRDPALEDGDPARRYSPFLAELGLGAFEKSLLKQQMANLHSTTPFDDKMATILEVIRRLQDPGGLKKYFRQNGFVEPNGIVHGQSPLANDGRIAFHVPLSLDGKKTPVLDENDLPLLTTALKELRKARSEHLTKLGDRKAWGPLGTGAMDNLLRLPPGLFDVLRHLADGPPPGNQAGLDRLADLIHQGSPEEILKTLLWDDWSRPKFFRLRFLDPRLTDVAGIDVLRKKLLPVLADLPTKSPAEREAARALTLGELVKLVKASGKLVDLGKFRFEDFLQPGFLPVEDFFALEKKRAALLDFASEEAKLAGRGIDDIAKTDPRAATIQLLLLALNSIDRMGRKDSRSEDKMEVPSPTPPFATHSAIWAAAWGQRSLADPTKANGSEADKLAAETADFIGAHAGNDAPMLAGLGTQARLFLTELQPEHRVHLRDAIAFAKARAKTLGSEAAAKELAQVIAAPTRTAFVDWAERWMPHRMLAEGSIPAQNKSGRAAAMTSLLEGKDPTATLEGARWLTAGVLERVLTEPPETLEGDGRDKAFRAARSALLAELTGHATDKILQTALADCLAVKTEPRRTRESCLTRLLQRVVFPVSAPAKAPVLASLDTSERAAVEALRKLYGLGRHGDAAPEAQKARFRVEERLSLIGWTGLQAEKDADFLDTRANRAWTQCRNVAAPKAAAKAKTNEEVKKEREREEDDERRLDQYFRGRRLEAESKARAGFLEPQLIGLRFDVARLEKDKRARDFTETRRETLVRWKRSIREMEAMLQSLAAREAEGRALMLGAQKGSDVIERVLKKSALPRPTIDLTKLRAECSMKMVADTSKESAEWKARRRNVALGALEQEKTAYRAYFRWRDQVNAVGRALAEELPKHEAPSPSHPLVARLLEGADGDFGFTVSRARALERIAEALQKGREAAAAGDAVAEKARALGLTVRQLTDPPPDFGSLHLAKEMGKAAGIWGWAVPETAVRDALAPISKALHEDESLLWNELRGQILHHWNYYGRPTLLPLGGDGKHMVRVERSETGETTFAFLDRTLLEKRAKRAYEAAAQVLDERTERESAMLAGRNHIVDFLRTEKLAMDHYNVDDSMVNTAKASLRLLEGLDIPEMGSADVLAMQLDLTHRFPHGSDLLGTLDRMSSDSWGKGKTLAVWGGVVAGTILTKGRSGRISQRLHPFLQGASTASSLTMYHAAANDLLHLTGASGYQPSQRWSERFVSNNYQSAFFALAIGGAASLKTLAQPAVQLRSRLSELTLTEAEARGALMAFRQGPAAGARYEQARATLGRIALPGESLESAASGIHAGLQARRYLFATDHDTVTSMASMFLVDFSGNAGRARMRDWLDGVELEWSDRGRATLSQAAGAGHTTAFAGGFDRVAATLAGKHLGLFFRFPAALAWNGSLGTIGHLTNVKMAQWATEGDRDRSAKSLASLELQLEKLNHDLAVEARGPQYEALQQQIATALFALGRDDRKLEELGVQLLSTEQMESELATLGGAGDKAQSGRVALLKKALAAKKAENSVAKFIADRFPDAVFAYKATKHVAHEAAFQSYAATRGSHEQALTAYHRARSFHGLGPRRLPETPEARRRIERQLAVDLILHETGGATIRRLAVTAEGTGPEAEAAQRMIGELNFAARSLAEEQGASWGTLEPFQWRRVLDEFSRDSYFRHRTLYSEFPSLIRRAESAVRQSFHSLQEHCTAAANAGLTRDSDLRQRDEALVSLIEFDRSMIEVIPPDSLRHLLPGATAEQRAAARGRILTAAGGPALARAFEHLYPPGTARRPPADWNAFLENAHYLLNGTPGERAVKCRALGIDPSELLPLDGREPYADAMAELYRLDSPGTGEGTLETFRRFVLDRLPPNGAPDAYPKLRAEFETPDPFVGGEP